MKLSSVYAENVSMLSSARQQPTKVENGSSFNSVFERSAETDKTSQVSEGRKTSDTQKPDVSAKQRANRKPDAPETENPESVQRFENENAKTGEINTSQDKPKNEAKPSKTPEEQVIEEISALTGIPTEEIMQILASLNMTPQQLVEPEKLLEFVMTINEVETPAELLTKPEVPELMTALKEIVAQLPTAESVPVETAQQETAEKPVIAQTVVTQAAAPADLEDEIILPVEKETPTVSAAATTETVEKPAPKKNMSDLQNQKQNDPDLEMDQDIIPLNALVDVKTDVSYHIQQARAQSAGAASPMEVVSQIAEKISVEFKADTTEMRMTLKPESLGEVSLKISTQNGIVTAQFVAESQRVKEIIESNFSQLRDSLTKQGVNISSLSVSVSSENSDSPQGRFNMERERSSARISSILSQMGGAEDEEALPEATLTDTQVDMKV